MLDVKWCELSVYGYSVGESCMYPKSVNVHYTIVYIYGLCMYSFPTHFAHTHVRARARVHPIRQPVLHSLRPIRNTKRDGQALLLATRKSTLSSIFVPSSLKMFQNIFPSANLFGKWKMLVRRWLVFYGTRMGKVTVVTL